MDAAAGKTPQPLRGDQLYRPADLSKLAFSTTAELEPADSLVGQTRALEAIRFGTQVEKDGFNLFVIGSDGARLQEAVKAVLTQDAMARPTPSDWIYVNNFADPSRPIAIALPAGRARTLHDAMRELIDDLKSALPTVFQSEDYQQRRSAIEEAAQKKQNDAFAALHKKATEQEIVILRTPMGFALAPGKSGQVIPPEEFNVWPEEKRDAIGAIIKVLEKELEHIVHQIPQWEKQRRDEVRQLNRDSAKYAVDQLIEVTKAAFNDILRVTEHIDAARNDLVENVEALITRSEEEESHTGGLRPGSPFDRYEVNILVSQTGREPGAPIVEELHPTLGNLTGRIEHLSLQGFLITNFRLIKAGALHRANGGYLLLDARSVIAEPFSWPALKRTLRRGEVTIEDVTRLVGLTSTISLEPDPIPLKVKVILFGDRLLYFFAGRSRSRAERAFQSACRFRKRHFTECRKRGGLRTAHRSPCPARDAEGSGSRGRGSHARTRRAYGGSCQQALTAR